MSLLTTSSTTLKMQNQKASCVHVEATVVWTQNVLYKRTNVRINIHGFK